LVRVRVRVRGRVRANPKANPYPNPNPNPNPSPNPNQDLNLGGFWGWAEALSVSNRTMSLLDEPLMLSMENQTRSFQYVVNAEGHGGWADRLGLGLGLELGLGLGLGLGLIKVRVS